MDFNKVISDMKSLQEEIDKYSAKEKVIKDAIVSINKDISKLEKKIEKETDEINKQVLQLKVLIMKDICNRFQLGG